MLFTTAQVNIPRVVHLSVCLSEPSEQPGKFQEGERILTPAPTAQGDGRHQGGGQFHLMLAPCYAQHKRPQLPGLLWLALATPGLIPDPTGSWKLTPQLERDQGRHSGCRGSRSRLEGQTPRTLACELSTCHPQPCQLPLLF